MEERYVVNFQLGDLPVETSDYLVIGSGIAGLYSAIKASKLGHVIVLTKKKVADSNTEHAQGGIAAAISEEDSPELHFEDTMQAGAGLCDAEAVEILVNEGPARVKELLEMGANFDREGGNIALTREGAHSRRRILHAHGDATGGEILRALEATVHREKLVDIREQHYVVELLTAGGRCIGALAGDHQGNMRVFLSKIIILATGGAGRLFKNTTNPPVATGDGIAIAYRAGAQVMDLEFLQFHPTALAIDGVPHFLLSEALRGEGAYLRNGLGERFMPDYHKLAELAPRDVVARAMIDEMARTGTSRVYLDMSHLDKDKTRRRFPTITATCKKYGFDLAVDQIPVAPSAHYFMGGVRTGCFGETNLEGLYACGEAACQGVHGANRLASNSLLDGLVFGDRIVRSSAELLSQPLSPKVAEGLGNNSLKPQAEVDFQALRGQIQETMWEKVGIIRDAAGVQQALDFFDSYAYLSHHHCADETAMEVSNMLTLGRLMAKAALTRTESRGGHFRSDYPRRDDENWSRHIVMEWQDDCSMAGKSRR
ncbi:MAG TPA: L-aspartate oxidase [Bacillota bacterium]|nr:L-aspartate oxidase [Bacillota bacterium]